MSANAQGRPVRTPSEGERRAAARLRLATDKKLGERTREWIVKLAQGR